MGKRRVLNVEDNFDNRTIYSVLLEHAGYLVSQAPDGAEGVALAKRECPDVILMDLSMPVMDGWTALDRLKAEPSTADIPVFALSAHVLFEGDFERALQAGFSGYFTKPIEPKRVLEELRARIGPPEDAQV
jgi:two-component system response regulator